MRRIVALVVMSALLTIFGCKDDSNNGYSSNTGNGGGTLPNNVSMLNIAFSPASITVPVNTTLTWRNNDAVTHTSTSDNGVWNTGDIAPGTSKSFTFTSVGTFPYHCVYHGGMVGTVIVQ